MAAIASRMRTLVSRKALCAQESAKIFGTLLPDPLNLRTGRTQLLKKLQGDRAANYYLPEVPARMEYKYIFRKKLEPILKATRVKRKKAEAAEKEAVDAAAGKTKAAPAK